MKLGRLLLKTIISVAIENGHIWMKFSQNMAVFQKKGCEKVCVVKISQKLLQLELFLKISYSGTFL